MPRYFFNLYEYALLAEDEEGVERADLEEARLEAIRGIRSLLADEVTFGRLDLRGHIEITDPEGTVLLKLQFREALEIVA